MDAHSHSHPPSSGGFWSVANLVLAAGFGLFALYWGAALFFGGISQARKIQAQKNAPPPPPAAAAPASPAAPAKAEAPPAAPAAANPALGVAEVTIKPDATNPLMFDTKSFSVKSGQKVRLTFDNNHPIPQPHNWVLCKPGTKDAVIAAAMTILTDPKALEKGYIPESPDILHHSKLLQQGQKETVEFTAGSPADYPYICTFPGHAVLMNGIMKVE